MITKLSNWIIGQVNSARILILLALLILFNSFVFPFFIVHFGPGEGKPLLDSLFGFNPDQASYLLFQYGEIGRKGYIITLAVVDTIYPFVYGGLLALILSWLLKNTGSEHSPLQKTNLLPVAGMVFDFLENLGIMAMLVRFPREVNALAVYSSLMGMAKWILVIITVLFAVVWAAWGLIGFLKRR